MYRRGKHGELEFIYRVVRKSIIARVWRVLVIRPMFERIGGQTFWFPRRRNKSKIIVTKKITLINTGTCRRNRAVVDINEFIIVFFFFCFRA